MRVVPMVAFSVEERNDFDRVARDFAIGYPEGEYSAEQRDELLRTINGIGREHATPTSLERVLEAQAVALQVWEQCEREAVPAHWSRIIPPKPSGLVANPAATVKYLVESRTAQAESALRAVGHLQHAADLLRAAFTILPGRVGYENPEDDDDDFERRPKGEYRGAAVVMEFEEA